MSAGPRKVIGVDPGVVIRLDSDEELTFSYEESWKTFTLEQFFETIVSLAGRPLPNTLKALFPCDYVFTYYITSRRVSAEVELGFSFYELTRHFTGPIIVFASENVPRAKAGSFTMVNVDDPKALQKRQFSADAPKWRIVCDGINVEGICTNNKCEAYKKQVIHMHGFRDLNFLECHPVCPICKQEFVPIKPGFCACVWTIHWKKTSGAFGNTPEERVDDEYQTYDEELAGTSSYEMVHIKAVPLLRAILKPADDPDEPPEYVLPPGHCSRCGGILDREDIILRCNHGIHKTCVRPKMTKCPICKAPFEMNGLPR